MEPITLAPAAGISTSDHPGLAWNQLSDEVVLEIFKNLSSLELAKIFGVDHNFQRLSTDHALVKTEISACRQLIQEFIEKNPTAPLTKQLSNAEFPWASNHWKAFKSCHELYRFNDCDVDGLSTIDPPEDHVGSPPLAKKLQQRYEQQWKMELKGWEQESFVCSREINYTNGSFAGFINALIEASHIKRLVISFDLSTPQLEILAQALRSNIMKIKELHLVIDTHSDVKALHRLFQAIGANIHLKTLSLKHNIRDADLQALVQGLQGNDSLKKLSFDALLFNAQGFQQLLQLLAQKPNLKNLDLKDLPDALVSNLFQAFGTIHLEELSLQSDDISEASALLFCQFVKLNPHIKTIQLPLKRLNEDVALKIIEGMSEHPLLKGCYMHFKDILVIRDLLRS